MPKRNYVSPESGRGGGKRRKSLSNDESCTVFVGNLKYETPWQALKDHMRRAGNVDSASILEDKGTRRSKGCGIVAYQNPRDAARAIRELNESLLEGRKIFVQTDSAKSQGRQSSYHIDETRTSSASVYVGNLSFDCNDRALFDHFKSCGRIRNAQVIVNEANGKSKGFARIDFNKVKDADDAVLDFNKTKFQGRPLIVKSWAEDERVTLYVGNLSYDTQDQELERLFSPFGKFLDAEIVKHNGRSKGFALVDFKSVDSAKRAMNKLDGTEFQGRPIYVRWDKDSADPQRDTQRNSPRNAGVTKKSSLVNDLPNTTVFVGNLDYECRWQDLKDLFKRVGRVEHAEIVENPVTKRSKGFGLVKFLTSSQAQLAIEKIDGTEFQNRCVQVKWDKKGQPVDSEESTFSFKRRSLSPKRSTSPKAAPKPAPERPAPSLDAALSSSR